MGKGPSVDLQVMRWPKCAGQANNLAYALILLMLGAKSSHFPRQNDIERSTLNWLYILITL